MHVHHVGFRIKEFYRLAQCGHRWEMTPKDAQHRLTILDFFARHGPASTCEASGNSRRTPFRWKQTVTATDGKPAAAPNPWPGPAKPANPRASDMCHSRCSPAIPWCASKPASAATCSPSSIPTAASPSPWPPPRHPRAGCAVRSPAGNPHATCSPTTARSFWATSSSAWRNAASRTGGPIPAPRK